MDQTLADTLTANLKSAKTEEETRKAQTLATNATARIERVTAALDEKRDEYVQKLDAAVLRTTKAIYQAFIDAIDRIKERLDERNNP